MAGFHVFSSNIAHTAQSRLNLPSGSPASYGVGLRQPPTCPECGSAKVWKDGVRRCSISMLNIDVNNDVHDDVQHNVTQRWLCRSCGLRFSQSQNNKKENRQTIQRRVCVSDNEMVNLATEETRTENGLAGATANLIKDDLKSTLFNLMWWMKKQGKYADVTINSYLEVLGVLAKREADLNDPESVKKVIAVQEWSASRKNNAVKAYSTLLEMRGLAWKKPKFKEQKKDPFIPNENEIDQLISGCSKQMATFLQFLKETGARRGEAFNVNWADVDFVARKARITPEKGSGPRTLPISETLVRMLNRLPRTAEPKRVWTYKNTFYLDKQFRRQRKRVAKKLENPRILGIHFHTLRHWRATMWLYETDGKIYKVMGWLGHKSVVNTERYIHLWQELFPEEVTYDYKIVKAGQNQTEEAVEWQKRGWSHDYNAPNGDIILKIPKGLNRGSSTDEGRQPTERGRRLAWS